MAEFVYDIKKEVSVLSESGNYTTEVNVIAYGENGKPKLDIRKWNRSKDQMLKGITLDKQEAKELLEALKEFDFELLGE